MSNGSFSFLFSGGTDSMFVLMQMIEFGIFPEKIYSIDYEFYSKNNFVFDRSIENRQAHFFLKQLQQNNKIPKEVELKLTTISSSVLEDEFSSGNWVPRGFESRSSISSIMNYYNYNVSGIPDDEICVVGGNTPEIFIDGRQIFCRYVDLQFTPLHPNFKFVNFVVDSNEVFTAYVNSILSNSSLDDLSYHLLDKNDLRLKIPEFNDIQFYVKISGHYPKIAFKNSKFEFTDIIEEANSNSFKNFLMYNDLKRSSEYWFECYKKSFLQNEEIIRKNLALGGIPTKPIYLCDIDEFVAISE